MTVIQLECFLEAVKQRSFSLAAANLYLSQPTMSRHIQALEDELRTTLFVRANNTIRLSTIGQILYPHLDQLYQDFRRTSTTVHEIVARYSAQLRIGLQAGLRFLPEFRQVIDQVRKEYPDTTIHVCHLSPVDAYSQLMNGDVDVLLSLSSVMPTADKLCVLPLYKDSMCLAVPREHPNAGLESISLKEIKRYFPDLDFLLMDAGAFDPLVENELRACIDFYDSDDVIKVRGIFSEMDSIVLMVTAGLGITLANQSCTLAQDPNVQLIPLSENTSEQNALAHTFIGAYWPLQNESVMAQTFLRTIKQKFDHFS